MIRKTLIALTAATALGAGALTPLTALAKPGGGFVALTAFKAAAAL